MALTLKLASVLLCSSYVVAVLQCILHAPGFHGYLVSGVHSRAHMPRKPDCCLLCVLERLAEATGPQHLPATIMDLVCGSVGIEQRGQQDAHDFLLALLKALVDHEAIDCQVNGQIYLLQSSKGTFELHASANSRPASYILCVWG